MPTKLLSLGFDTNAHTSFLSNYYNSTFITLVKFLSIMIFEWSEIDLLLM